MAATLDAPQDSTPPPPRDLTVALWLILLLCAIGAAHWPALNVPFLFDDHDYLLGRFDIHTLSYPWPWARGNSRPILYLSFAINDTLGGTDPWAFHIGNMLVHGANVLLFFGLLRRALRLNEVPPRRALTAAGGAGLLWAVHPITVNVVGYVWQRGESLAATWYLLALYCLLRLIQSPRARLWGWAIVGSCCLAMMTKETAVSLPLALIVVDRAYGAGSWHGVLNERRWVHLGAFASWGVLAFFVRQGLGGFHSPTQIGFGSKMYSAGQYLLTMPEVHLHYLRLAFWPHPLCLDWNWPIQRSITAALPAIFVSGSLLIGVLYLLWKHPRWGAPAAVYCLVFAPSSSIMPMPDPVFEYRLYLPLAFLCAMLVAGADRICRDRWRVILIGGPVALSLALGIQTRSRYAAFASPYALWRDTLRVRPDNPRALAALGFAADSAGKRAAMLDDCRRLAEQSSPRPDVYLLLGQAALGAGRTDEARDRLHHALTLKPDFAQANILLGNAYEAEGNLTEAEAAYSRALRIKPLHPDAHVGLGRIRLDAGADSEALAHAEAARRLWGDYPPALHIAAMVRLRQGEVDQAQDLLERALFEDPEHADSRLALARLHRDAGNLYFSRANYIAYLEVKPKDGRARLELARVLAELGLTAQARHQWRLAGELLSPTE